MSEAVQRRQSKSSRPAAKLDPIVKKSARQRSLALVSTPSSKTPTGAGGVVQLLTPDEACQCLKVSTSWLKRSDLPYVTLGRLRRYREDVILEYLDARTSLS